MASKQNRHNMPREDGPSHGRINVQGYSTHHEGFTEETGVPRGRVRHSKLDDAMDLDISTSAPKPLPRIPSPNRHESVRESQALERENSELNYKLNEAQHTINSLRQQLEERQHRQQQPAQTSWWPKGGRQEEDYHRLKAELEKKGDDLSIIEVELQRCQATLRRVTEIKADTRRGIEFLQKENFDLREQLKLFEAEIKRSQEKSIREMTDGRWGPVPDDMLRDRLNTLYLDIRDWARKWVGGPLELDNLPSDTRQDFVRTYLSRVVPVTEGRLPPSIEMPNSKMKEKLPGLLLTGVLAHEVQSQFFDKPFFCFKEGSDSILAEVYKELTEANPREGHIWRSTMWRIMNPPQTKGRSERDQEVANVTFRRTQKICDHVSADFKKGHTKILLKALEPDSDVVKERARTLRDIFMNAVSIARTLWTQRAFLICYGIKQLESMPFDIESQIMEAHPLNKVDYQNPQNNGRKIGIVIRPSLLACGEDNHEGYDVNAFRVLAKALVWLGD